MSVDVHLPWHKWNLSKSTLNFLQDSGIGNSRQIKVEGKVPGGGPTRDEIQVAADRVVVVLLVKMVDVPPNLRVRNVVEVAFRDTDVIESPTVAMRHRRTIVPIEAVD